MARLGGLADLSEVIFFPSSCGIFYLVYKKFVVSQEKDCFDNLVFEWESFYFRFASQKVVAILFVCIK